MELNFSMAVSLLIAIFLGFSIGFQQEISFSHREKYYFYRRKKFRYYLLTGLKVSCFLPFFAVHKRCLELWAINLNSTSYGRHALL